MIHQRRKQLKEQNESFSTSAKGDRKVSGSDLLVYPFQITDWFNGQSGTRQVCHVLNIFSLKILKKDGLGVILRFRDENWNRRGTTKEEQVLWIRTIRNGTHKNTYKRLKSKCGLC